MKMYERFKKADEMTLKEVRELLMKTRDYLPRDNKNHADKENEFMSVFFYLTDIIN